MDRFGCGDWRDAQVALSLRDDVPKEELPLKSETDARGAMADLLLSMRFRKGLQNVNHEERGIVPSLFCQHVSGAA